MKEVEKLEKNVEEIKKILNKEDVKVKEIDNAFDNTYNSLLDLSNNIFPNLSYVFDEMLINTDISALLKDKRNIESIDKIVDYILKHSIYNDSSISSISYIERNLLVNKSLDELIDKYIENEYKNLDELFLSYIREDILSELTLIKAETEQDIKILGIKLNDIEKNVLTLIMYSQKYELGIIDELEDIDEILVLRNLLKTLDALEKDDNNDI